MKFYRNGSFRYRDIDDILVSTGNEFFKPEVDTQTHRDYMFLESEDRADYKNMFF